MTKATKAEAGYRDNPNRKERCAVCSMFESPHGCSDVAGRISPNGWCTWGERERAEAPATLDKAISDAMARNP